MKLWRRLFGPRPRSRTPLPSLPPMSGDWCRTCQRDLRVGEVWELRKHFTNTQEMREIGVESGGTWVASTYCKDHAPVDAVQPLPFKG